MTKKEFIKLNNQYKIEAYGVTLVRSGSRDWRGQTEYNHINLENGFYYKKAMINNPSDINYYLYNEKGERLAWEWRRKDFIKRLIEFGIIKE